MGGGASDVGGGGDSGGGASDVGGGGDMGGGASEVGGGASEGGGDAVGDKGEGGNGEVAETTGDSENKGEPGAVESSEETAQGQDKSSAPPAAEGTAEPQAQESAGAQEQVGAPSEQPNKEVEKDPEASREEGAVQQAAASEASKASDSKSGDKPADPFAENRTKLTEAFKASKALDEQSMTRLGRMMSQFENRMASLAATRIAGYKSAHGGQPVPPEVSQKILDDAQRRVNDTYKHLTENVGTEKGPGELFNQADRASMSENLLFHVADPTNMDQGQNGTCWINSSTASYGMMSRPDDMARFMKEISLTGKFNAAADGMGNGARTVQFDKGMFYASGEERNWKISNALNGSARSPVGMFMDEAMTEMVGKRQADAGNYEGSWGAKRIMTMITGEAPPAPRGNLWSASVNRQMNGNDLQVLMDHGGFQTYSPGHLQSVQFMADGKYAFNGSNGLTQDGQPMKLDGSDPMKGYIVLDNQWGESNDHVSHYVNNGNIQDIQDQRFNHFDPGKVDNERAITIKPGNDSNGGGGGGGGGGGFIDGGGVNFLRDLLPMIQGAGGNANPAYLTQPGGWVTLLRQLTALAEKEVSSGHPGPAYQKLSHAVKKMNVAAVVDDGTLARMNLVLAAGAGQRAGHLPAPRPIQANGQAAHLGH